MTPTPLEDALAIGVAVLDPSSWRDDGDAYTVAGVSRPTPTSAPTVTGLTPAALANDDPPTEVLVAGTDFTLDCRLTVGGSTPPTSFHTDTELAVRVDPAGWTPGSLAVMVAYSNRGPSNAVGLDITAATVQASGGVPDGTISDVLAWVGDDPARAQQALDAERSGANRSTLISQLEAIAG